MNLDLERLLDAIKYQESRSKLYPDGGDPNATSEAGAQGPYQIMPKTAAQPGFGVNPIAPGDMRDETKSREFARQYMQAMLQRYGGNVDKALAAYNGGPGRADKGGMAPETRAS